jgi:hypothetical protein
LSPFVLKKQDGAFGWLALIADAVSSKYFAAVISATFEFKTISLEDNTGFLPQYVCNFHRFDSDLKLFKNVSAKIVTIYRTTFPVFFNMVEDQDS